MSLQIYQQWVQQVGMRIGNPGLSATANACTLEHGKCSTTIELEESTDTIHIWSVVANLPDDLEETDYAELYHSLLQENSAIMRHNNAHFALDTHKMRILLCSSIPASEDHTEAFHILVTSMLSLSQLWHTRFNEA